PKDLDPAALASVLEGGLDKSREVGLSIIGGHTVDDPEPKYGMAVTGLVDIERIITSSAARPGMQLILTKRIGTGVISTALKAGRAPEALVAEATSSMKSLNKDAARVMRDHAVAAATDVTGFGLLGHLHNLLRLSGVSARLQASKVHFFEGVAELVGQGSVSGGTRRNRNYFERWVTFDNAVDPLTQTLLFDAQTSGGMLMAVDPQRVELTLAALSAAGVPAAAIGEVLVGDGNTIEVAG
ncbi:MAG TPA: selenide, water dikinase SelD, partial [Actinomycetota bacterium]|nr:selenide, water dikinase SelD [Actinomycetota bacterium]